MATESDLIIMLNKLLDSFMADVISRLAALEANETTAGIRTDLNGLKEKVANLERKVSRV